MEEISQQNITVVKSTANWAYKQQNSLMCWRFGLGLKGQTAL